MAGVAAVFGSINKSKLLPSSNIKKVEVKNPHKTGDEEKIVSFQLNYLQPP